MNAFYRILVRRDDPSWASQNARERRGGGSSLKIDLPDTTIKTSSVSFAFVLPGSETDVEDRGRVRIDADGIGGGLGGEVVELHGLVPGRGEQQVWLRGMELERGDRVVGCSEFEVWKASRGEVSGPVWVGGGCMRQTDY